MLSRSETIKQAVSEITQKKNATPVSFSGSVSQVNIISHATINIDSMAVGQPEAAQADQGEQLAELVHTLAAVESAASSRAVTPEAVWLRLKRALQLAVDQPVPLARQREAMDLMMHRLTLARRDLQRDPETARKRAACYRCCHAIAQQHGLYGEMRQHMASQWGADSMRDLEDEQLWSLETHMRQKERESKANKGKIIRLQPSPERS